MQQARNSALRTLLVLGLATLWPIAGVAQSTATPPTTAAPGLDTTMIERLTGAKGTLIAAEGVFKVSVPRTDLDIRVGGVRLRPRQGLTSWAAFQPMGDHAMLMGDLVLLEAQVNPVMSVALDAGLEVTALHNHFLGDEPRVMFMHIGGHGTVDALATAVGKVFRALAEKPPAGLRTEIDPVSTTLAPGHIEEILGAKGELKDGVLRFAFGRATKMAGTAVGNAMGVNTWAAFAGSDEQAVVDGDFAMEESELQPVLKALRKAGVEIVAIHSHMSGEEPRILFLHYWGIAPAVQLAKGLRTALDAQTAAKSTSR